MPLSEVTRQFLILVRHGRIDNSYKMVWAKAIVELSVDDPQRRSMPLEQIANKIFGYYWNLHIFFDPEGRTLRQSSNSSKPPVILQYVLDKIGRYKDMNGVRYRARFYEQLSKKDKDSIDIRFDVIGSALKKDVRHRFLKYAGIDYPIYDWESDSVKLLFAEGVCADLAVNADSILEAVDFRWTRMLEDFNRATPRIAAKISLNRDAVRRGGSLKKFHKWLEIENPNHVCSLCGSEIEDEQNLSVDHLIPFSFLFSDDIWNLAFSHKGCNSQKSDRPPTKKALDAQYERNHRLHQMIIARHPEMAKDKVFKELDFSLEEHLLRKMWHVYRG